MTRTAVFSARHPLVRLLMLVSALAPASVLAVSDSESAARAVFDTRCVACHSCYNAPCQLDLASPEGILRGATRERVYDGTRLLPAPPTRLFIDARTPDAWHTEKGFFPVITPQGGTDAVSSILGRMVAMKRRGPDYAVDPDDVWLCPSNEFELAAYRAAGWDGMPYGFPALEPAQTATIERWLAAGAPLSQSPSASAPHVAAQLEAWEQWLNEDGAKARLVARYLYEHLFLAHLVFAGDASQHFYRLVRSRTAPGDAVDEIATLRPYDPIADEPYWYRFARIEATITHKTHLVFPLSDARLARYRKWFLEPQWRAAEVPSAQTAAATYNPFTQFAAIPAAARYRFMLDNARFFVMSFIRGPVCEGQMAVNVIDDHFQVLFLSPDHDLSILEPDYLPAAAALLALPSAGKSDPFESYYAKYKAKQRDYTRYRADRYASRYPSGPSAQAVWDGERRDPDAWLTVFRHFDNASVQHGARGGKPKSMWVVDYPIFERIYYLLVAGFNVYGNAFHQASTRLYMDNLRVESEDLFLDFLPPATRLGLRQYWYRGEDAEEKMHRENPLRNARRPSGIRYSTDDPPDEWLRLMADRIPQSQLPGVDLHPAVARDAGRREISQVRGIESWLARLTVRPHAFVRALPDASLLRVTLNGRDHVYSLLRTKAHLNVSFMFEESDRRIPAEDSLSIVRGFVGSYPNHFFAIPASRIPEFVDGLLAWQDTATEKAWLFRELGASRYEADFWDEYDRFEALMREHLPVESGVLDLSKYSFH